MNENKTIRVNVQTTTSNNVVVTTNEATQKRVGVISTASKNPIAATPDTGLYYSQIAKNWAISEGLVENQDYSSKTYATQSKAYADESKMYSESASLDYNNLSDTINQYNEQISGVVAEGINTIETTKTEASEYVETTANESIVEVNQAKEQAIKDFNKASDKINYLFVMPIGHIGFSPFPIDETKGLQRILNGQIIIQEQFDGFVKWLKENIELYPQMACTEEEWQTAVTMSINGTCDKFVINDEAGTIRLPKYPKYCNKEYEIGKPTTTLSMGAVSIKGNGKTLGFTNGSKNYGLSIYQGADYENDRLFSTTDFNVNVASSGATRGSGAVGKLGITTDASKSGLTGSVTGTATTNLSVTETMQKGYWFIQLATGAEESVDVTREIELNNPFFFGYYQYFEVAPNNISWLKSEGQWNDKAVYTDYYDWILTNANNGVENFKLSTDTYDDYAWVVNTADETFRLPIKTKNAPFKVTGANTTLSMGALSIKGNGKTLGLTDGSLTASPVASQNYAAGSVFQKTAYNTNVGTVISSPSDSNGLGSTNKSIGVTTDASKSGLTGSVSGTATTSVTTAENTNVSLYFYVGETVQNANLVNVGRIEETVVNKINRTGDTMTGTLTLQDVLNIKRSNTLDYTDTNHTTVSETAGEIYFRDKNDEVVGYVQTYFNQYNNMVLSTSARRSINGTVKTAQTQLYVDSSGNANFTFPMCTTKATTTSSASTGRVAVVVQNYVSGTSWYRVWSDGWIEQGGYSSGSSGRTVALIKSFATTNYSINGAIIGTSATGDNSIVIGNLTTSNFKIYSANATRWYACGY